MKIKLIEDVAGMKKDLEVEVDQFTGSEMVRLGHAEEVNLKEEKATRQTKEEKNATKLTN